MLISVRWGHEWAQGNVYRISGGTIDRAWAEAGDILTLDDYVIRLLRSAGIKQVMTREEFLAYETSMTPMSTS